MDLKDYDLSAKNPAKNQSIIHRAPAEIMKDLESNEVSIQAGLEDLKKLFS